MRKQKGFTLIELMIVVAIVGILAAIAIPAYRDFQIRSKISEVLASMGACKTTVAEFYESNDGLVTAAGTPIDADICQAAGGGGDRSRYLNTIVVDPATGRITAAEQDTGALPAGGTIGMTPRTRAGGPLPVAGGEDLYEWVCGLDATTIEPRFRPGSCQG
ncbi:MAG: prepilin-type N-terminal cleavage/methylation domain-containing protein [Pseudomonadota bacterium]